MANVGALALKNRAISKLSDADKERLIKVLDKEIASNSEIQAILEKRAMEFLERG